MKTVAATGFFAAGCTPSVAATSLTPEQFGAKGDGVSADGGALAALVDSINATPGSDPLFVRLAGNYNLAGAPERPSGPVSLKGRGTTFGLPIVTRSNVSFDATGARFTVPADVPFRRVVRGGDATDRFFVMWHFVGSNIRFTGGIVDGNLEKRPFERGPRPIGFGGLDFGFILEGPDWTLDGVTVRNWGTDCALVMHGGRAVGCVFERARRNGLSVVAATEITPAKPVVIERNLFVANGDWPDNMYNNPAAGLVIEAGKPVYDATAIIRDNEFRGNKLKDMQLAKAAVDCEVSGNIFTNDVRLRPMQKGGHRIVGNDFRGQARIYVTTTDPKAAPVVVNTNTRNGVPVTNLVRHTPSSAFEGMAVQEIVD